MLSGNNSIINQAISARNKTNEKQDKEKIEMEVLNCHGKNGSYEIEDLKTNLSNMGATVTGTKFPLSVEYNGKKYIIDEDGTIKDDFSIIDENWDENKGVNVPKLVNGLTAVTFNNDGSVTEVSGDDSNWYDYTNKKWANAVTKDKNGKITGYWVWIPRYEYKINSSTKTVNVKFIPVTQTTEDSGYDHIHPAFRNGSSTHYMNGEWDSELPGFWVAKFPAGYQKNTITDSNGTLSTTISNSEDTLVLSNKNYSFVYGDSLNMALGKIDNTTKMSLPVFLPLTYAYNCINTGDIYTLTQEISKSPDFYGLNENTYSHMLKNSEWGAITYLTQSQYGRNGTEMNINNYCTMFQVEPYKDAVTGIYAEGIDDWPIDRLGNAWYTSKGQLGSSTGNMTGIYDLNGCVSERVAGYITNESYSLVVNPGISNWIKTTKNENGYLTESSKYYTIYPFDASTDKWKDNWNKYSSLKSSTYGYGDAMLEITTTVGEDSNNTWLDTASVYMESFAPFIDRGGNFTGGPYAGSFAYGKDNGYNEEVHGFRVVFCP